MTHRKKLLFFAHAVTMAHFARPLKWIEGIDTELFDVYLASHQKFRSLCSKNGITFLDLSCIDAAKFEQIVVQAKPIYDATTFEQHIQEDIRLMDEVKPDLVIGDFRHSLTVSCRIKKIKYVNLTNAYWHPETKLHFPLPEAPIVRFLGVEVAKILLGLFLPLALRVNFFIMAFALRKSFKSASLNFVDYRQVIVDGDLTLFCDTPELVPLNQQLPHEKYVGPVIWSMPVELPEWWSDLDCNKKRVFLTLGSSGPANAFPTIVEALAGMDCEIVVALAGKRPKLPVCSNVFVTDFLPIDAACQDSDLVICNGGSPVVHAALTFGVPTIGIVCNNDQLLNMAHVSHRGAGILLRYWDLTGQTVTDAVNEILDGSQYLRQAQKIQREFESIDVKARLQHVIDEGLG